MSIDKTKPTATATVTSLADKTSYGWYNKPVTVSYKCLDDLGGSGIDTCSPADTLGEGTDQSATGAAVDTAGNTGSAAVTGINVDTTAPVLTGTPSSTIWTNDTVTVTWACTDAGSGSTGPRHTRP